MKKITVILTLALASCAWSAPVRYGQLNPPSKQAGGFNAGASTFTAVCFDDSTCQSTAGGSGSGLTGSGTQSAYGGTNAGNGVGTDGNAAIGFYAMGDAVGTGSSGNVALGTFALKKGGFTQGYGGGNVAIGNSACLNMDSGWQTTAIGMSTYQSMTSGFENTGIGYAVGINETTANHNVAIGNYAMGNLGTNDSSNVCIGHSACGGGENHPDRDTQAGLNTSVVIGALSTAKHPLGASNPFIQPTNVIALGYMAEAECMDCMVIGSPNLPMRISIGTTTANSSWWIDSKRNIAANGLTMYPNFDGYSLKISTDDVVNQWDLSVSTSGVVAPRILKLTSKTAAQIVALTPETAGQEYYCSDCTTVAVCVSTGTAQGAWALITNKGSACQ